MKRNLWIVLILTILAAGGFGLAAASQSSSTSPPSAVQNAAAATIMLNPVDDAYIDSVAHTSNYGDARILQVQDYLGHAPYRRSLLRFDLSHQIPADATITSAVLEMYLQNGNDTDPVAIEFVRIMSDWTELGVNWDNQPTVGDPTISHDVDLVVGWKQFDITAIVRTWLTSSNYGVEVRESAAQLAFNRTFGSREHAGQVPRLVVTYVVPTTPTPTATCTATPTRTVTPQAGWNWRAYLPVVWADIPDACENPNPHRAIVSEELEQWHNWLDDGGFEEGTTNLEIRELPGQSQATVERSQAAARTGSWGYAILADAGEGAIFSAKAYVEKGDNIRFSFWARSLEGEVSLQPKVYGMGRGSNYKPEEFYTPDSPFTIGPDWTEVVFETFIKEHESVLLSLEVGPDTSLYIDDMQIEQHIFKMAEYSTGKGRIVGGIPVPLEPAAPVHFTVLIHIEDPAGVQDDEEYFWQQTARMAELARVLHEHGGFLTIQPEEDWPMASDVWQPGLLSELASDYDVVYSTHTHGPHCRDDQGRLRSYSDCQENQDTPGWDQTPNDYENPWVTEYVTALRDLLEEASGTSVTDHNGNWEFAEASTFAEIPMLTWSAYKDFHTQSTYDVLINNPWRPTECNADLQIAEFLTHDPTTPIVYVPGWGQNIARYLDRLPIRVPPVISQFIRYADPNRVNTFYIVTHVGSFEPRDGEGSDTYITYDTETDELVYSDEFLQDLQYWDDLMSEVIDPLVEEGYLQWTSLPEMGELYRDWEKDCGLR